MKLSGSFYRKTDAPNMEVVCTAHNINPGYNPALMKDSDVLYGYSVFVDKVRKNHSLTEKNQLLNDENARLRKALADAGVAAD